MRDMQVTGKQPTVLLADDDPEDQFLLREAFNEVGMRDVLVTVKDGQELLDYLQTQADAGLQDGPSIILLDLNMPRKSGREALEEMRRDPRWRRIPVIILTTSSNAEDVDRAYMLGANSFITKPESYDSLLQLVRILCQYWFSVVELPPQR